MLSLLCFTTEKCFSSLSQLAKGQRVWPPHLFLPSSRGALWHCGPAQQGQQGMTPTLGLRIWGKKGTVNYKPNVHLSLAWQQLPCPLIAQKSSLAALEVWFGSSRRGGTSIPVPWHERTWLRPRRISPAGIYAAESHLWLYHLQTIFICHFRLAPEPS